MAGGRVHLGSNGGIASVEILDLNTNTWRSGLNPLPEALYAGASIPYEDSFLAVGGTLSNPSARIRQDLQILRAGHRILDHSVQDSGCWQGICCCHAGP